MEFHKELQLFVNYGCFPAEYERSEARGFIAPCCAREFPSRKKVREHVVMVLNKDFTRCLKC